MGAQFLAFQKIQVDKRVRFPVCFVILMRIVNFVCISKEKICTSMC